MEGWKSIEPGVILHWLNGSDVSFAVIAAAPWHLLPSNVNIDWSW
jgi:hypothetical protein